MSFKPSTLPYSPFSAPFSKTAKETGLRIRSLFQWQKRRPPLCLLLVVCGVVLISGSLVSCRRDSGETPLTEDELDYFNQNFFNGDTLGWNNQFLTCTYESPAEVDLYQIFYNGMEGASVALSQEERLELSQLDPSAEHLGLFKVTADEMDAILRTYLGIGLEETAQNGLDSFYHLEAWDAYYLVHGDTNVQRCQVTAGTRLSQDCVELNYTKDDGSRWVVTLRQNGDGYYFQSNVTDKG